MEKICNRLENRSTPSGRRSLLLKLRVAEVQHRLDTALFRKEYHCFWKANCIVVRPDALSYCQDAA
jgi:hypothetical protein